MKTVILAKSSSGEPYDVTFDIEGDSLRVNCSCKAGALQQQFKHKRALVRGDGDMLHNRDQADALRQVLLSSQGQSMAGKLRAEEAALAENESQKSRIAAEEKAIKARMSKLF